MHLHHATIFKRFETFYIQNHCFCETMGHGVVLVLSGEKFQNHPPVCSILLWVNQQSEVDRKYKVAIYFDFAKKEV